MHKENWCCRCIFVSIYPDVSSGISSADLLLAVSWLTYHEKTRMIKCICEQKLLLSFIGAKYRRQLSYEA